MNMKCQLVPIEFTWTSPNGDEHKSIEKVMLISEGYPEALIHVDSLLPGLGSLSERIQKGETLNVEIIVEEIK
jgi:hypothetical protein